MPGVYGPFLGLEQGLGFENVELDWAASILAPGSVLVDIGANIGAFCINVLRRSDGVSALAVEPVGRTYRSLGANVTRNELSSRITAIRAAVGEAEGDVLITSGLNAANHIVPRVRAKASAAEASAAEEHVRQASLDILVADHELQRVDLLKVDVEGFELSVLKGARETLRQFRPAVLLEIEARWTRRYSYAPSDIFAFMTSFGYEYHFFTHRLQTGSGDLTADLSVANNFVFLSRAERNL